MLGFQTSARSGKGRSLFAESKGKKKKKKKVGHFPTASTPLQFSSAATTKW